VQIESNAQELIDQCLERALYFAASGKPMPAPSSATTVTIVIPIYNARAQTLRCIELVLAHTAATHSIMLADDASTDVELVNALQLLEKQHSHIQYERRAQNLGFIQNVNLAIAQTQTDVVLLNSDTEVSPQWLDRLQRCALRDDKIAATSPCSDRANHLSLGSAEFLARFNTQTIQERLAQVVDARSIYAPTLVGFCMYLKRDALQQVGTFDPIFGKGYGEEDDWCQRARSMGWQLAIAHDVFVRHLGGASFAASADKTGLSESRARNRSILAQRWPNYETDVRTWWRDWPLRPTAERLRARLEIDSQQAPKQRMLHVLHRGNRIGGTENFVRSLIAQFPDATHTVMSMDPHPQLWADVDESHSLALAVTNDAPENKAELNDSPNQNVRWVSCNAGNIQANRYLAGLPADLSDPAVERQFVRFLANGGYQLVHFHHLAGWNSLLLPSLAAAMGLPVLLSAHCHYFLCPDPDMALTNRRGFLRSCNFTRADAISDCESCLQHRQDFGVGGKSLALANYLALRTQFVRQLFADIGRVFVPSQYLFQRISHAIPEVVDLMQVIPHAIPRPAQQLVTISKQHRAKQVLKLVAFCGDRANKGFVFLQQLARVCSGLSIKFWVYGVPARIAEDVQSDNFECAPAVQPEVRDQVLAEADLTLIPSQVAETFSLVLSESLALGVPVIATHIGALVERIKTAENGWCLAPEVSVWREQLAHCDSTAGRKQLQQMRIDLLRVKPYDIAAMAQEYFANYQQFALAKPLFIEHAIDKPLEPNTQRLAQNLPKAHISLFDRRARELEEEVQTNGPRVLALLRNGWAASYYRLQAPLQLLSTLGSCAQPWFWRIDQHGLPTALQVRELGVDQLWILHATDPAEIQLLRDLAPLRCVYFLDDALHLRARTPSAMELMRQSALNAMAHCHDIVTTTSTLASLVNSWQERESQVARSAVDKRESQVARSAVDKRESQVARSAVDKRESFWDKDNESNFRHPQRARIHFLPHLFHPRSNLFCLGKTSDTNLLRLGETPNSILLETVLTPQTTSSTKRRLRVLWAGASQHKQDLEILRDVIVQTHQRYQWVFFGDQPADLPSDIEIEFHPPVDFVEYVKKLESLEADVALAPLVDNEFNRHKSPLKLLEFGVLGVSVIASDVGPYRDAPIALCRDTESWLANLQIMEDPSQRILAKKRLSEWLQVHHGDKSVKKWSNFLCLKTHTISEG
jgi:GT2 family glycosyltransferase/glycosyltransferase involved in cell wall biosynthesis